MRDAACGRASRAVHPPLVGSARRGRWRQASSRGYRGGHHDEPRRSREESADHVREVVVPEIDATDPDGDRHADGQDQGDRPGTASEDPPDDERQRHICDERVHGMPARKAVSRRRVSPLELRTWSPEHQLEDLLDKHASGYRECQEQRGSALATPDQQDERDCGECRQHDGGAEFGYRPHDSVESRARDPMEQRCHRTVERVRLLLVDVPSDGAQRDQAAGEHHETHRDGAGSGCAASRGLDAARNASSDHPSAAGGPEVVPPVLSRLVARARPRANAAITRASRTSRNLVSRSRMNILIEAAFQTGLAEDANAWSGGSLRTGVKWAAATHTWVDRA